MYRTNTTRDVIASGIVQVDAGDGVTIAVPLVPSEGGGGVSPDDPALYDSGWRNITSRVSGVASGKVLIRRTGPTVWVDFNDVLTTAPPANEWHTWNTFLPAGFGVFHDFTAIPLAFTGARVGVRPETEPQVNPDTLYNSAQALGPVRFDLNGRAIIYGARTGDGTAALTVRGMVSFPTNDAIPSSPPGTPA